jgi:hypothetical protein
MPPSPSPELTDLSAAIAAAQARLEATTVRPAAGDAPRAAAATPLPSSMGMFASSAFSTPIPLGGRDLGVLGESFIGGRGVYPQISGVRVIRFLS